MRRVWIGVMVTAVSVGCVHSVGTTPAPPDVPAGRVNPANIKRVRRALPPGYEVTGVADLAGPPTAWGLGAGWTADPPRCAALADPTHGPQQSAQGVSASGAGGVLYTMVATAPVALDPALLTDCPQWTMTNGRAVAGVRLVDPPRINGVATVGMASNTTTSAEGGNVTVSRSNTFTAYMGSHYAFTTLLSDPGSPHPPLSPQVAADLLVRTVAELRR
jgi:hypothetical protein